ncbi:hypothetical protein RFI_11483 [Reticulomyxa filosa]|uniref:Uncharacterized protein n=1 Tax=Reticulomyxa filosa TaxID=46433 RepID=X6NIT6_RETFI|nr:hypothetical protein RFI_11483 [Reticulomyxa filosa]|eukprot:ETO25654.1 hypothetical protein RFI_11483 [Reticulomyxa filosa]
MATSLRGFGTYGTRQEEHKPVLLFQSKPLTEWMRFWRSRWRKVKKIEKVYLGIVILHALMLFALGVYSLIRHSLPKTFVLLAFFIGFCFFLFSVESVLTENYVQLRCSILSAMFISAYLVWYYADNTDEVSTFALVLIALSCIISLSYVPLYYFVKESFGWYRYEAMTKPNEMLMKCYLQYQSFNSFLQLDTELVIIFIFVLVIPEHSRANITGSISWIIIQFVWTLIGFFSFYIHIRIHVHIYYMRGGRKKKDHYIFLLKKKGEVSVRFETRYLASIFLMMSVIIPAYFIAELYWILSEDRDKGALYITRKQYIVTFVLFVLARFLSLYWSVLCILNFGKGLKNEVFINGRNTFMTAGLLNQVIDVVDRLDKKEGILGKTVGTFTRLGANTEEETPDQQLADVEEEEDTAQDDLEQNNDNDNDNDNDKNNDSDKDRDFFR